jgi:hypothetical protein
MTGEGTAAAASDAPATSRLPARQRAGTDVMASRVQRIPCCSAHRTLTKQFGASGLARSMGSRPPNATVRRLLIRVHRGIEEGTAQAERVAGSPGDTRCYPGGVVLVSGCRCRS